MSGNKIIIFLLLVGFVLGLMAFQKSTSKLNRPFTDSLRFVVPANFPKPVYAPKDNQLSSDGFLLGKALFYDAILSSDKTVSCGNCHQASAAFANVGIALSTGVKNCAGTRNAPALFNLAWRKDFMWDGRIDNMHDVPVNALTNPCEMANTMDSVVSRLEADKVYPVLFKKAFGNKEINASQVLKALAQFTSMLVSADSKYDKHVRKEAGGDFTVQEESGYRLFIAKCSSCHTEPLFTDGSYRNNGLDEISADRGRDSITNLIDDRGKFHVPSLRNVEITKPYMHDGRFSSLREVLKHYSSGMKNHVNLDPVFRKGGNPGIPLTSDEQLKLIAFLKTLTDIDFINDQRFVNH